MIFDTHAHYDAEQFDADRDAVLSALPESGVGLVIDPGCEAPSSLAAALILSIQSFLNCPARWRLSLKE